MVILVPLQSYSSASWEIHILKQNQSLSKVSLLKYHVSKEDDALYLVGKKKMKKKRRGKKKGGGDWSAHTVLPAGWFVDRHSKQMGECFQQGGSW